MENCKPMGDFSREVAASTFPLQAIHVTNEALSFLQNFEQMKN